ncbi:MAG: hypothetical protein HYU36_16545 [Planctomycetes bacterium]|nr:hypothetical protein [Planctomycetota bacterium]
MLYEFALTVGAFERFSPAVEPATNQSLVQVLHGIRENGILASLYNGSWWAEVQKKRGAIPDRIRPLTLDLLSKLFDRGLVVPRPKEGGCCPKSDVEWLDEALASHGRATFQGIIARKDSINARTGLPSCAMSLEDVLLSPAWNDRKQSRRVPRKAADFEAALTPVLYTARSIVLIDPYIAIRVFRGNREFLRTLSIVDKCALPNGRRCPLHTLEIHTQVHDEIPNDSYAEVVRSIRDAMPRSLASAKQRLFRAWRPKPNGKPFHNRRIVTNQTAVSCPWGLDIHEHPGHTPGDDEWSLLDDDVRTAIWRDFQPNTSPYDLHQDIRW